MCPTDVSVHLTYWMIYFQLKPSTLTVVPQKSLLHILIAKNDWSREKTSGISLSIKVRGEFQQWKHHIKKTPLSRACDRHVALPCNLYRMCKSFHDVFHDDKYLTIKYVERFLFSLEGPIVRQTDFWIKNSTFWIFHSSLYGQKTVQPKNLCLAY